MENLVSPQFLRNPGAKVSLVAYGDDSTLFVKFEDIFLRNEPKSSREGRPIDDHFIEVDIEYPANRNASFKARFPADEESNEWIERFPSQWKAFKARQEQMPSGIPIETWPALDKRRVFELKSLRIHTVEQIAALTDATGPNMGMDWRKLRDMASAYLKPELTQAMIAQLNQKIADLENRLQMNNATPFQQNLTPVSLEETPKRRGRPPKQEPPQAA